MNTAAIIFAVIGAVLCGPGGWGRPDNRLPGPGGRGRHHGPPPPPFLRNMTQEAQREFFEIRRHMNETIAQQKQEILEWAKKYNVESQVEEFNANMTRLRAEIKQNVTALIGELPSAFEKFSAILENENQTPIEMMSAIRNLTSENPQLYRVLKMAMKAFKPGRPHGRRGGSSEEMDGRRGGPRGGFGGMGGMGGPGGMMGGPQGAFGDQRGGFLGRPGEQMGAAGGFMRGVPNGPQDGMDGGDQFDNNEDDEF
ncbi:unnamed protein product [Nippostrongylus brasiliensis]|uniref:DUF148 domain-containing protein n=1 Tax=Nippostrongylus brasiliensis TaxID=27835 RepID=A0A0N4XUP2_NIPBR|nr:unnamed protein product [Nippostrongylus brasiliensis]